MNPKKPLHIIFVRHGEYDGNISLVREPNALPLNDRGRRQIRATRARLAAEGILDRIDEAVTSPFQRARDTMNIINPTCDVKVDDDLRERDRGDLQGMSREEYVQAYPENLQEKITRPLHWKPPGPHGEALVDVLPRLAEALQRLEGSCSLLTVHAELMWAARCRYVGLDDDGLNDALKQRDVFEIHNGQFDLYTRVDPRRLEPADDYQWFRSVRPWGPTRGSDTGWMTIDGSPRSVQGEVVASTKVDDFGRL